MARGQRGGAGGQRTGEIRFLGTFITVFTSEKQSGFYKTYLELDSYGAQDRLAAATKDPK